MKSSLFIYGVHNPTTIRKILTFFIFIALVLCFWGIHSDFIPYEQWAWTGFFISITLGSTLSFFILRAFWTGNATFKRNTSRFMKAMVYLWLPCMVNFIIWVSVVHGIGALVSEYFGQPMEKVVTLEKKHNRSRRSCDFHLDGVYLDSAFPSRYCISERVYNQLPIIEQYRLFGLESNLGYFYDYVEKTEG